MLIIFLIDKNLGAGAISAPIMIAPSTELESATFCSASKRSIQLSYEGKGIIAGIIYPSEYKPSRNGSHQTANYLPANLTGVKFPASLYKKASNVYTSADRLDYIAGHRQHAIWGLG